MGNTRIGLADDGGGVSPEMIREMIREEMARPNWNEIRNAPRRGEGPDALAEKVAQLEARLGLVSRRFNEVGEAGGFAATPAEVGEADNDNYEGPF